MTWEKTFTEACERTLSAHDKPMPPPRPKPRLTCAALGFVGVEITDVDHAVDQPVHPSRQQISIETKDRVVRDWVLALQGPPEPEVVEWEVRFASVPGEPGHMVWKFMGHVAGWRIGEAAVTLEICAHGDVERKRE